MYRDKQNFKIFEFILFYITYLDFNTNYYVVFKYAGEVKIAIAFNFLKLATKFD